MHTTITHCDLCSRVVEGPGIELPVHGMAVTLGYSRHGWGRRQDFGIGVRVIVDGIDPNELSTRTNKPVAKT